MTRYDASKPITLSNWPSKLKMPPLKKQQQEPKFEKQALEKPLPASVAPEEAEPTTSPWRW